MTRTSQPVACNLPLATLSSYSCTSPRAGHACALAPALPPDATCLACGGITELDQVRELRAAGYDGVVIGRGLTGAAGKELLLQVGPPTRGDESATSRL